MSRLHVRFIARCLAAGFVAGGLFVAPSAGADARDQQHSYLPDPGLTQCTTESQRPASEIVLRTGAFENHPPGVSIVEGETLCLAGLIDASVRFTDLWLADRAAGEPTLVEVKFAAPNPPPDGSVPTHPKASHGVRVRTSLPRLLRFALRSSTEAAPVEPLLRGPGKNEYDLGGFPGVHLLFGRGPSASVRIGEDVHEVLLDDLWTGPLPPPGSMHWSPPLPPLADRMGVVELTLRTGVRLVRSLEGLDSALRASGYGPFPRALPSLSGTLAVNYGRGRYRLGISDAWTSAPSRTGSASIDGDLMEVNYEAGYDFLRWRGLSGFAIGGVALGRFTMDARGANWNYLGSRSATLGNPDRIDRDGALLTLQAGFDQIVPLTWSGGAGCLALIVSIQGGYDQELGFAGWNSDARPTAEVSDRASMDFGGAWVAVGAGIAFVRAR